VAIFCKFPIHQKYTFFIVSYYIIVHTEECAFDCPSSFLCHNNVERFAECFYKYQRLCIGDIEFDFGVKIKILQKLIDK